ncbi:MAG TPA: LysR substrate-binding domain-containing protein [Rubrivivax sp.]|jgi:DNA-binding transcriptional LysR family regulator|nr:LysR substrate-binding domain-containing protein [Rubrivivax sp.]
MQKELPHRLPSLDRLAVFDAAARHLSFTRAAAELFLTQSAVSRQIAALESELGAPLFRRRHRALDLSDDGRRLAAAVATALAGLQETVSAIRGPLAKHRREVVTLTTTPGLASLWLIPRLADFTATHPGVDVRIDATHDVRSLASEGFDLAIRYGMSGKVAGTPLFQESVQPVCAPSLLKRGPPLKAPADLRAHTLLQTGTFNAGGMPAEWQSWLTAVGAGDVEPASLLTFSSYDTAVSAALAGQGVVLGRRPLVDRLLRKRELIAPFQGEWASARGYGLLTSAASARRPSVQELAAWLLAQASEPSR